MSGFAETIAHIGSTADKDGLCWYCWKVFPRERLHAPYPCIDHHEGCDGITCNGICDECDPPKEAKG